MYWLAASKHFMGFTAYFTVPFFFCVFFPGPPLKPALASVIRFLIESSMGWALAVSSSILWAEAWQATNNKMAARNFFIRRDSLGTKGILQFSRFKYRGLGIFMYVTGAGFKVKPV